MPRPERTEFEIKRHTSGIYYLYYPKWFANEVGQSRESTGLRDEGAATRFKQDFVTALDAPPPEEERTVAEAIHLYMKNKRETAESIRVEETKKRKQAEESIMRAHYALIEPLVYFGDLHMRQINKSIGNAYIKKRRNMTTKDGRSYIQDGTIRKEMVMTTAALNYAAKEWDMYVKPFTLPKDGASKGKIIPNAHIVEFLAYISDNDELLHLYVFCMLMLYTFARPGAIFGLTWERVFFDHGYIDYNDPDLAVSDKKRGNPSITTALHECLVYAHSRRDKNCAFVVQRQGRGLIGVKTSFQAAMRHLNFDYTPYDLKHTAITTAIRAGISIQEVSLISGVSEKTLWKRYYKYSSKYKHALDPLQDAYNVKCK